MGRLKMEDRHMDMGIGGVFFSHVHGRPVELGRNLRFGSARLVPNATRWCRGRPLLPISVRSVGRERFGRFDLCDSWGME